MIKIPGGTDRYYCINDMTRHDLPATFLVVRVPAPDHLSAIMFHIYIDTALVSCYNSCSDLLLTAYVCFVTLPRLVILFVVAYYACSALHIYFIVADICPSAWSPLSRHHYMFMSITSPLDNLIY